MTEFGTSKQEATGYAYPDPRAPGVRLGSFWVSQFSPMPVWTCMGCCWLLQLLHVCLGRPMKLYMFVFQGGGEFHATCQRRPCFCFSALSLFMFFVYCMCSILLHGVIRMNIELWAASQRLLQLQSNLQFFS